MKKLHISDDLSLPLDFVTQTQAILAKRGVGKSYTASVEAEELLKAGQQVVVIDPTGAWFGLKSSADGKSAGFPIAVFGGEHADVPLEESAGEIVAQAIIERRFSAIIDLSFLRKNQRNRFMTAFLETLFRLNRVAMHLFVDEAHTIAPQKPFGEEARMLGAIEDVVMLGRRRGLGCTLITQRPQVLNKNVLTQCEILCCLRLVHPKDIDAVEEWVNVHADETQAKEMIVSLPSLPIGTAWFWAPGWGDIFKRVKIRKRETFDSSATPKAGEAQVTPKVLAPIDIEKLGQQITATVERAKENDPAQLKRKIAELQKQVATHKPPAAKEATRADPQQSRTIQQLRSAIGEAMKIIAKINAIGFEGVGIDPAQITQAVEKAAAEIQRLATRAVESRQSEFERLKRDAERTLAKLQALLGDEQIEVAVQVRRNEPVTVIPTRSERSRPTNGNKPQVEGELSGPEQRILNAIAWLNSIGVDEPEQTAVAFLAGYTIGGGAWGNPRGRLNSRGFVEYLPGDRIRLTDEGRSFAQSPDAPLDAEELQRRVLERLPGPESKILRVLIENREGLPNEELAEKSGYAAGGGAYGNPRGRLRSLGLIEYRSGLVVPKPLLFLESA